jgi:hypothetical protein
MGSCYICQSGSAELPPTCKSRAQPLPRPAATRRARQARERAKTAGLEASEQRSFVQTAVALVQAAHRRALAAAASAPHFVEVPVPYDPGAQPGGLAAAAVSAALRRVWRGRGEPAPLLERLERRATRGPRGQRAGARGGGFAGRGRASDACRGRPVPLPGGAGDPRHWGAGPPGMAAQSPYGCPPRRLGRDSWPLAHNTKSMCRHGKRQVAEYVRNSALRPRLGAGPLWWEACKEALCAKASARGHARSRRVAGWSSSLAGLAGLSLPAMRPLLAPLAASADKRSTCHPAAPRLQAGASCRPGATCIADPRSA